MFFRNIIIMIWSANAVWKMIAVNRHHPASSSASGRAHSPINNKTLPPISQAAAGHTRTPRTPNVLI
jgi:hypothetical protein